MTMAKLGIPSLQHLARNWQESPKKVEKTLVRLAENPPIFNYNRVYSAVEDLLLLNVPVDQVVEGIKRAEKREGLADNFIEIIKLIHDHFLSISPAFVNKVSTRSYSVGRSLMVPFTPPLIYGIGGQLYFPWFSFWRSQPLSGEQLSLFVTLVYEILGQDPDLEDAKFEILDFSAPKGGEPRDLVVLDARDIPRLTEERKQEMLNIFAEGFGQAKQTLSAKAKTTTKDTSEEQDSRQIGFDGLW
jgi:hypothetical protein